MSRAYVFDGGYLIHKMTMDAPLPSVFLMKKKAMRISLESEPILPMDCIEKQEYKYLFKSPDNGVLIYSNDNALDFIERNLRFDGALSKEQLEWHHYEAPIVMTFERREVIERIMKDFIGHIRMNNSDADNVIAETCAKRIEAYLVNNF